MLAEFFCNSVRSCVRHGVATPQDRVLCEEPRERLRTHPRPKNRLRMGTAWLEPVEFLNGVPDNCEASGEVFRNTHEAASRTRTKTLLCRLIPLKGTFDIELDGGFSLKSVLLHFRRCERRSITWKAGCDDEGFSRYRWSRSSASFRWLSGTGISSGCCDI